MHGAACTPRPPQTCCRSSSQLLCSYVLLDTVASDVVVLGLPRADLCARCLARSLASCFVCCFGCAAAGAHVHHDAWEWVARSLLASSRPTSEDRALRDLFYCWQLDLQLVLHYRL